MEPQIETILEKQRAFFATHRTKDIKFRIEQLKKLKSSIVSNESKIIDALYKDLHKSDMEAYSGEIGLVLAKIRHAVNNLHAWARPAKVKGSITVPLAKAFVRSEPYGIVLIISPWNYPFILSMSPLICAMAAGNCAVVKPSEFSSNTSQVMQDLLDACFDRGYVSVIQGDVAVAQRTLQQRFDYIFYTGNGLVGKEIMKVAAEHLTPMAMELGGKCPCVVDSDIDYEKTARRITWGKFQNAGQTCVAPDYLMVHKSVRRRLVDEIKRTIGHFYGQDVIKSKDFSRIINERHYNRILKYLDEGDIVFGGDHDAAECYIGPTLIENVSPGSRLMQEEIFGPILPVVEYSDIAEAISYVNSRPKPLALYIFSNDKRIQDKVLCETSSGGVCINDTVIQSGLIELPFGGVGNSGFGRYHGKAGFDLFSNKKSVMRQTVLFDLKVRYPPFKVSALNTVRRFQR
jgi:aldehyde dehydrogenase (NAD+)